MADGAMNEFRGVYATYMYRYDMNEIQLNKYSLFSLRYWVVHSFIANEMTVILTKQLIHFH